MTFVSDPIGSGFVASLARPGGNITGLTNFGPDLSAKWLELLKELSPKVSRIGILYNSAVRVLVSEIERTAKKLAVQLYPIEVNNGWLSSVQRSRARLRSSSKAMLKHSS